MKINFIIICIFISLLNTILSETTYTKSLTILKKNEKVVIEADKNVVVFESDSFKEGNQIYFKITATSFYEDEILFEFYDNYESHTFNMEGDATPEKTKNAGDVYGNDVWTGPGTTNFYKIKKDKKYLGSNVQGKYLGIYFNCPGQVLVENYEKDDNTNIIIIVFAVIVVVGLVIAIICYCYRRRKLQQVGAYNQNGYNNGYNGNNINVYNQQNQGNYGPQQNNQNFNMNMNQRHGGNYPYNNNNPNNNNNAYNNNNNAYNNNNNAYNNNNNAYNNNGPYGNNPQQYSGLPQNSNDMRYG